MDTFDIWPWTTLFLLGAFHGVNPGMGWLFAVALGMQERRSAAVWRALPPLAAGHALAIGAALAVASAAGVVISVSRIRWPVAALLIGMGVYRLFRHRHPRGGSMRVGAAGLTTWSFLMASAHGAGLMVVPVFLGLSSPGAGFSCHGGTVTGAEGAWTATLATGLHGVGYLLVTAVAAWAVYAKLGVGLIRKAWINLDLIWAAALIATGGFTLFL
jgi:hypothetical protein